MRTVFESLYNNGSSAIVENDFKELKTQILRHEIRPMKADKFIITHLKSIETNAKLFRSTQLRNMNLECNSSNKHSSNFSLNIDSTIHKKSINMYTDELSKNVMIHKVYSINEFNETVNKINNTNKSPQAHHLQKETETVRLYQIQNLLLKLQRTGVV